MNENIHLFCECLANSIPNSPTYPRRFVDCFVCSPDSQSCKFGQCNEFPSFFESVSEEDLRFMITWYQWEEAVQKTNGKQSNSAGKMMEKICKERTLEEQCLKCA